MPGTINTGFSSDACASGQNTDAILQSAGTFGGFVLQVATASSTGQVQSINILVPGYWRGSSSPPTHVYSVGGHGGSLEVDLGWTQFSTLQLAPNGGTVDLSGASTLQHAVVAGASAATGTGISCSSGATPLVGEYNMISAGPSGYVILQSPTGSAQRIYNTNTSSISVCPDSTHEIQLFSSTSPGMPGMSVMLAANQTALFVTVSGTLVMRSP